MKPIFDHNGLVSWNTEEVETRRMVAAYFMRNIRDALLSLNHGWRFAEVETPVLMPESAVSSAYDKEDYYTVMDGLVLRPNTVQLAQLKIEPPAKMKLATTLIPTGGYDAWHPSRSRRDRPRTANARSFAGPQTHHTSFYHTVDP